MCISSITMAELLHGVEKSTQPEHNQRQVESSAGCKRQLLLKAFTSPATWLVYRGLQALLIIAYKLAGCN